MAESEIVTRHYWKDTRTGRVLVTETLQIVQRQETPGPEAIVYEVLSSLQEPQTLQAFAAWSMKEFEKGPNGAYKSGLTHWLIPPLKQMADEVVEKLRRSGYLEAPPDS